MKAARSVGLALAWAPALAQAHGSSPGLRGFISGMIHPLSEPMHLLALVAAALLVGQHGFAATGRAAEGFIACLAVGLVAAGLGLEPDIVRPLLAAALAAGVLVAIGRRWPAALVMGLAGALGLCVGLNSAPEGGSAWNRATVMAGTFVGGGAWLVNGAMAVQAARRPWLRVLVRVVASWLAACALLALVLSGTQAWRSAAPAAGAASAAAGASR